MRCNRGVWALVVFGLLSAGCIEGDEITTIAVHEDGAADVTVMRSHLHSSTPGAAGRKEEENYRAEFDAEKDSEVTRIREAGGTLESKHWIKKTSPMACALAFRLPEAKVLEKYLTIRDGDGPPPIETQFVRQGNTRQLLVTIRSDKDASTKKREPSTADSLRQAAANGIGEIRLSTVGGNIVEARGFHVSKDRHTALLDDEAVESLLEAGKGTCKLWVEWTVGP